MEHRRYIVTETREVAVEAASMAAAIVLAEDAFQNPGQPDEGMKPHIFGMPKVVRTIVERD